VAGAGYFRQALDRMIKYHLYTIIYLGGLVIEQAPGLKIRGEGSFHDSDWIL
jgi:hypothetical protein